MRCEECAAPQYQDEDGQSECKECGDGYDRVDSSSCVVRAASSSSSSSQSAAVVAIVVGAVVAVLVVSLLIVWRCRRTSHDNGDGDGGGDVAMRDVAAVGFPTASGALGVVRDGGTLGSSGVDAEDRSGGGGGGTSAVKSEGDVIYDTIVDDVGGGQWDRKYDAN